MFGLPRFKTDSTRLRENLAGTSLKNFMELERVLGAIIQALEALQGTVLANERRANVLAPKDNAYGCWVINQDTLTEEDFQYTVPCIVLNADLQILDDADILILD